MANIPTTSLRLTAEDRRILKELRRRTGLGSFADVIRLAVREAVERRCATCRAVAISEQRRKKGRSR
jgi:hypothetical protein